MARPDGSPLPLAGKPRRSGFTLRLDSGRVFVEAVPGEAARAGPVSLLELSMEVPDVSFPFDVSGGAERFRSRRCRLWRASLTLDPASCAAALEDALPPEGLLATVELEAREGFVELSGQLRGSPAFYVARIALEPDGGEVRATVADLRLHHGAPALAPLVETEIIALLAAAGGGVPAPGSVRLAPLHATLRAFLPGRGFKTPDLGTAAVESLRVSPRAISAVFSDGATAAAGAIDATSLSVLEGARAFAEAERILARGDAAGARSAYLARADEAAGHPFAAGRLLTLLLADPSAHDEALDLARLFEERSPGLPAARWVPARILEARGDGAGAARLLLELSEASRAAGARTAALLAAEDAGRVALSTDPALSIRALGQALSLRRDRLPSLRLLLRAAEAASDREALLTACRRLAAYGEGDREMARAHRMLGQLSSGAEARLHLEQALRLDPDDRGALEALAAACSDGDPARAARALARAAEIARDARDVAEAARLSVAVGAIWEQNLGNDENALLRYREAAHLSPGDPAPLAAAARVAARLGRGAEAAEHLAMLVAALGNDRRVEAAAAHRELARLAEAAGDLSSAARNLEAAAERAPAVEPLLALAAVHERGGDASACASALERAALLSAEAGERAALLASAGSIRVSLGEASRGRALLETAVEADPSRDDALEALASVHLAAGSGEAAALFERLLALPIGPDRRGRALVHLAGLAPDPARAAAAAREAAELLPDDPAALAALVEVERAAGSPALAGLLSRLAIADPARAAAALLERADILLGQGDEEGARADLLRALDAEPDAVTLGRAGERLLALGDPARARAALELSLARLGPEADVRLLSALGRATLRTGDEERAAAAWLSALRGGGDVPGEELDAVLSRLGRPTERALALELRARGAAASSGGEAAELLARAAALHLEMGMPSAAAAAFGAAVALAPGHAGAETWLGSQAELLRELGDLPGAAEALRQRAALLPAREAARALYMSAELHGVADPAARDAALDAAVERDPTFPPARIARAAFQRDPRRDAADLAAALAAPRSDPDAPSPAERANLLQSAAEAAGAAGDRDLRRRHLSQLLALRPDDDAAAQELTELARAEGDTTAVVELLAHRAELSEAAAAVDLLLEAAGLVGPATARELLGRARDAVPRDVRVLDALLPLLDDPGQRAQVLSELASVTPEPSRAASLRMDEARARALAGDAAGARTAAGAAASISGDDPAALDLLLELSEADPAARAEALERRAAALLRSGDSGAAPALADLGDALEAVGDGPGSEKARRRALEAGAPVELAVLLRERLASAAERRGETDVAAAELAEAAGSGPPARRAALHARRAALLLAGGQLDAARSAIDAALSFTPRDHGLLTEAAQLARAAGDPAGEADFLEGLLATGAPGAREDGLRLSTIVAASQPARAEAALRRVLLIAPGDAEAMEMLAGLLLERGGEAVPEAVALRRSLLGSSPSSEAAGKLLDLAALARSAGDSELTLSLLRDAAQRAPDRFDTLGALARELALQGAVAEAHPLLQRAVALDRGEAPDVRLSLLRLLADVAAERGAIAEAEEALSSILQARPWDEGAARDLARLLGAREPARAADVLAGAAFAMADGEGRLTLQLELARAALEAGDAGRAGRHLADARRLAVDPVAADLAEADLARAHRQPALAAAALARAAPRLEGEAAADAYDALAAAAGEAGDIPVALAALGSASELLAVAGRGLEAAARARDAAALASTLGDHAAAEAAYLRSLALEPGHAGALRAVAELARSRGDAAAEASHLEAAIAASEDGPARARLLLRLAELSLGPLDDGPRGEHALLQALASDEQLGAADALLEAHLERHQRRGDLAAHLVRRARGLSPDQASPVLARAADLLEEAGLEEPAADAALAAHEGAPDDAVLARRAADRAEVAGRLDVAARLYTELQAKNPHDAGLAARLAALHERRGDLPALAALTERRALMEPAGRRAAALLAAGRAYEDAGLEAEALRCEHAAFDDDPGDDRAFARVVRRATDAPAIAALLARRARAVPAEAAALHRARGEVLAREGMEREALAALDDALLLAPDDVAALSTRAEIVSSLDGDDAAAEVDRRLVALADRGVAAAALPAVRARYRLALAAADLGASDAARLLEKALEAEPRHPRALAALVALERILAEAEPGRRLFEVRNLLAERAPDARTRVRWLTSAAEVAPDPAARLPLLRELAAEDPAARPALLATLRARGPAGWTELADELVSAAAAAEGPQRAELLLEAAHLKVQLGDAAGGANLRDAARAASPEDPAVLRALLPDLRAAGHASSLAGALAALAERTGDPAEREQALLERASELSRATDPGALEAWREVLAGGPRAAGFAAAAAEARRLLEQDGRLAEAAAVLELLAQGTLGRERSSLLLAAADLRKRGGDRPGAAAVLDAAAASDPEDPAPWMAIADLAEAAGDPRRAAEALDEAIGRTGDADLRADARLRRAALLEQTGDATSALAAYRQVAEDRPADRVAHRILAAAAQAAGDGDEELIHVQALLLSRNELGADEAKALEKRLAWLSARAGHSAEAAALYEAILRDDPSDEEAYAFLRTHRASRKAWNELLALLSLRDRSLASAGGGTRGERRDVRLERARILAFELGRAAEAEEAYRAVLELDPRSRAALAALRELAERRGDHVAAAAALEGELASAPPAPVAAALHLRLGRLREQHLFDAAGAAASFAAACELALSRGGPAHLLPEAERGLARASLAAGNPGGALAALERRFRSGEDAADPRLRALAAEAALALNDPAAAAGHLRAALEVAPGDAALLARLEAISRSEGPEALSAALLQRAGTSEDPALRAEALLRLSDLRRAELRDDSGAEDALRQVLEIDPAHDAAYERLRDQLAENGRSTELLELHRRRARKATRPEDRARALLAIGEIHRGPLPDPRLAADAFERALSIEPGLQPAAEGLASAYLALGRDADAEPLLRRLLTSHPSGAVLLALGELCERDGRLEEALDRFERAVPHGSSRRALARVAAALDRHEEALVALRAELAASASLPPAELATLHRSIGDLERRLLRNAEATRSYEAATALDPDDRESPRKLYALCVALGDLRRAEAALRTVASRMPPGPERADVFMELGELRISRLSDPVGATGAFENARADRPGSPAALRRLMDLYAEGGRHGELLARAEELQAAAGDAALEPYLVALGRASRAAGDGNRALELLSRALAREPMAEELRVEVRDLCFSLGRIREYAVQEAWLAEREASRDSGHAAARLRALAQLAVERLGDRAGAVALMERAATLAPATESDEGNLLALMAQDPATAGQAIGRAQARAKDRPWDLPALESLSRLTTLSGDADQGRIVATLAEAFSPLPSARPVPVPAELPAARFTPALWEKVAHPAGAGPLPRLIHELALALEPLFPSDLGRLGAVRGDEVSAERHPVLAAEMGAVAPILTDRRIALHVAAGRGLEAGVENTRPAAIVLGEGLLPLLSPSALRFVLARQVSLVSWGWTLVGKFPPHDLLVLCAIACRVFLPDVPVPGLPPERIEPYVKAASRTVSPDDRQRLAPLAAAARHELAGLDPRNLALGLRCTASRAALVVSGDAAGAVEALLRLDRRLAGLDRASAVAASPELADLCDFALGGEVGALRREAGLIT